MRRNVPRCGINNRDVAVDDVSFAFPWNLSRLRDVGYCIFRAERAIFRQNELLFWQLWFYLWCLVKCVGAFVWVPDTVFYRTPIGTLFCFGIFLCIVVLLTFLNLFFGVGPTKLLLSKSLMLFLF